MPVRNYFTVKFGIYRESVYLYPRMPVLLVVGALYFILNLMKQENISLEPVDIALDLNSGIPRLKVKTRIYNPSQLPLRITQIQALAVSGGIRLGTFNMDRVITLPGESNTLHYLDLKITPEALMNLRQIYQRQGQINITGYAIANGVRVNFNKNVQYA